MPLLIENIHRGEFIAVARLCLPEPAFGQRSREPAVYGGEPLEVLSVSPPFVCVKFRRSVFALDMRVYEVYRVTEEYAREWGCLHTVGRRRSRGSVGESIMASETDSVSRCIRCGERLQKRLSMSPHGWVPLCPQCGWVGEVMPC